MHIGHGLDGSLVGIVFVYGKKVWRWKVFLRQMLMYEWMQEGSIRCGLIESCSIVCVIRVSLVSFFANFVLLALNMRTDEFLLQ